jgi:hypothetical protein
MARAQLELVQRAGATPGRNSSQTPLAPRTRIGWQRPSHWLKSPTTLTRSAFGAQVAKARTRDAVHGARVRAEHAVGVAVAALAEQVQVEIADLRRETVGVDVAVQGAGHVAPVHLGMRPWRAVVAQHEQAACPDAARRHALGADPGGHRPGAPQPDLLTVAPEQGEGVVQARGEQAAHVLAREQRGIGRGVIQVRTSVHRGIRRYCSDTAKCHD